MLPHQGILRHYGAFLPLTESTPLLSLGEGDTPLVASTRVLACDSPVEWIRGTELVQRERLVRRRSRRATAARTTNRHKRISACPRTQFTTSGVRGSMATAFTR